MSLATLVPDGDALLQLEPEEIGGVILEFLHSREAQDSGMLNRNNFGLPHVVAEYPRHLQSKISHVLMEGWIWLEREGLIAPDPQQTGGWVFLTRRGERLRTAIDLAAYQRGNLLPRQLLHPVIAGKTWSPFLRGEYDTAVFQAFKELEVATRQSSGFGPDMLGVPLMRNAFNIDKGPLADVNAQQGERQALSDLFAGAIGVYKNPHSHRQVSLDAEDAVEMIMLASHLLKIVDARATSNQAV